MDGNSIIYTTELEKFSVFEPNVWKTFEMTKNPKYLEELSLYIPEKYQNDYNECFKDYMNQKDRDVSYNRSGEDEIRETRKEA